MPRLLPLFALATLMAGCSATAPTAPVATPTPPASSTSDPTSIEAKTNGLEHHDGFVPVYWDATKGTIWLEIRELDTDLLYVNSLAAAGVERHRAGSEPARR